MNKLPRVHAFDDEVGRSSRISLTLHICLSCTNINSGHSIRNVAANGTDADITHTRKKV